MFFNQRKNKRFNYSPKYRNSDKDNADDDIKSKWHELRSSRKRKRNIFSYPIILALFLIAVLVLMYVLGRYE